VYIFQLINLYKDPDGKYVFNEEDVANTTIKKNGSCSATEETEVISGLRKRVRDLENELQVSKQIDVNLKLTLDLRLKRE